MVSYNLWWNYIHRLSQIDYHHGSGRDLPAWSQASQSDREHVASLERPPKKKRAAILGFERRARGLRGRVPRFDSASTHLPVTRAQGEWEVSSVQNVVVLSRQDDQHSLPSSPC